MRKATAALAIALISMAGCTTKHHEGGPVFSEASTKAPQDYAACLTPKWQAFVPAATSTATDTGVRIAAPAQFTGEQALANVDGDGTGSKVTVILGPEWAGTTAWTNMARACL